MYFVHKLGFDGPQVVNSLGWSSTGQPQVVNTHLLITARQDEVGGSEAVAAETLA